MKKSILTAAILSVFASPFFVSSAATSNQVQSQSDLSVGPKVEAVTYRAKYPVRVKVERASNKYIKVFKNPCFGGSDATFATVLLPEEALN